jgi:ABC-2 type transport system ATP-binding protein
MNMADDAIVIQGLAKRYKQTEALRDLTFTVPRGSVCGFLGRNGTGKTTTIRIMMGAARQDAGTVHVLGHDASIPAENLKARQRIGFVSENKELYPCMKVGEVIGFTRSFFPAWRDDLEKEYVRRFELPLDRTTSGLSRGTHTKLMLLLALARGAELLVLDEPTEGLDPVAVEELLQAIVALAAQEGTTVFFSSHDLEEVEQIADRVTIIEAGRTVLTEQLDSLQANYRAVHLMFATDPPRADLRIAGVESVNGSGRSVSLLVSANLERVVENAKARQAISVEVRPVSLKEIFLGTVKGVER